MNVGSVAPHTKSPRRSGHHWWPDRSAFHTVDEMNEQPRV